MKVANLCDSCKYTYPECNPQKIVFGIDCDDISGCVSRLECDRKYLDAVVACESFATKEIYSNRKLTPARSKAGRRCLHVQR
jgi:hypothetical protein